MALWHSRVFLIGHERQYLSSQVSSQILLNDKEQKINCELHAGRSLLSMIALFHSVAACNLFYMCGQFGCLFILLSMLRLSHTEMQRKAVKLHCRL